MTTGIDSMMIQNRAKGGGQGRSHAMGRCAEMDARQDRGRVTG